MMETQSETPVKLLGPSYEGKADNWIGLPDKGFAVAALIGCNFSLATGGQWAGPEPLQGWPEFLSALLPTFSLLLVQEGDKGRLGGLSLLPVRVQWCLRVLWAPAIRPAFSSCVGADHGPWGSGCIGYAPALPACRLPLTSASGPFSQDSSLLCKHSMENRGKELSRESDLFIFPSCCNA